MKDKIELRKFGILTGVILIILGAIPLFNGNLPRFYLVIPAFILIYFGLLRPGLLEPIYKGWMKIGYVLGRINSFLLLSIIYFLILTPIGIISRTLSRNSERFRFKRNVDSYWIKKEPVNIKENIRRQF